MVRVESIVDRVTFIDLDKVPLQNIFKGYHIDLILHCATNYGRKKIDALQMLEANLMLPIKLLELGSESNVRHFINTDTILDKRISNYSLSKGQFKEWLKLYSGRINCINVALEHFYGPGDDDSKFVSNIIQRVISNVSAIALTPGSQKRDFIYIDDVVTAFKTIIDKLDKIEKGYTEFEIGSNSLISIHDLVCLIANLAGNSTTSLQFGALPYRPNEIMESHVNLENIKKLGWSCKTPIQEGLIRTIEQSKISAAARDFKMIL